MKAYRKHNQASGGDLDVLHNDSENFSLVLGGPLFQLLRRAHLANDALMMVRQRKTSSRFPPFAWLPLLGALDSGRTVDGPEVRPFPSCPMVEIFIAIPEVYMPLLIVAELVVHRRMRPVGCSNSWNAI